MDASFARESQWSRSVLIAMASLVAVGCGWVAPRRPRAPKPPPVERPTAHAIEAAITRGVDFLVRRQNRDGSWGSPRRTKALNIYAPVPGAHYAFRAAVTALCLSALIESADHAAVRDALHDRILDWMNRTRDPFRAYYWERRPWRTNARPATWPYTAMTRQRENEEYEPRQLDYDTGLEIKEAVRKK